MKIFKLFSEIQAIRNLLTLIFKQQSDLNHKLSSMQSQIDNIQSFVQPEFEEFEGEDGDIRISSEVYKELCKYLDEDEIDLMGIS